MEPARVPVPLRPLFTHLRTTRKEHVNLLPNGAGKSFASRIYSTLDLDMDMNVRTSTTNDPRSDSCGVDAKGVVDVAVVS